MIRVGDYKLILYPEAKTYRLFNLKNDPTELQDLAPLGGKHTKKAKQLFKEFLILNREIIKYSTRYIFVV